MNKQFLHLLLLILLGLPFTATYAEAKGTLPGTEISNWATLDYSVGGVNFPDKVSNKVAFTVLELIEATVTWQDAANILVTPGDNNAVTTFRVTNNGNGSETFTLAVDGILGGDIFDPAPAAIYFDTDSNGRFDPLLDSRYLAGTNDLLLPTDGTNTVFVLCNVPLGPTTGETGKVQLAATSRTGTGSMGTVFPALGDNGSDAMLGISGGIATAIGTYEALISEYNLELIKVGEGTVAGALPDPVCGSGCITQIAPYPVDATVTLTSTPAPGYTFVGWTGACTGAGTTCTVVMSEARSVTAIFVAATEVPVGRILINNDVEWTATRDVTLNLNANDDLGVVGWLVAESSTVPVAGDPGWNAVPAATTLSADVPFTMSASDGVKTAYAWYRDAEDNVSIVASDSIKLDTTPPVSAANPPGGNVLGSVTVALSCDDGTGSGCATIHFTTDGSTPTAASTVYSAPLTFVNSTTLKFFAVDKLGNSETTHTEIYLITAPVVPVGSILINNDAAWTATPNVTLNLNASDDQGIAGWLVSESATPPALGDMGWTTVPAIMAFTADVPFTLASGDGNKTVYAWYRDADDNVAAITSDSIKLDTTPPVSVATPPGGTFLGLVTVALACDDGTGSGCATTYYTTDGSTPTAASPIYSGALTFFDSTTLKLFAVDKLGNREAVHTESYLITAPEVPIGKILINNDAEWTDSQNVTLNLIARDDKGAVAWLVSESPTAPSAGASGWNTVPALSVFTADVPSTLSNGDGIKTVYAWYRDADDNVSVVASDAIKLDTTPPVSAANPPGGNLLGSVTVVLSCDDGTGSGCATIHFTTDGSTPTAASPLYSGPLTFFFSTTLKFFAVDKLDNSETIHTEIYLITSPEISSEIRTHQSAPFAYPVGATVPDNNLRHIPGSYHQGLIRITNKRSDPLDNVAIVVPIPSGSKFCIDDAKTGTERYIVMVDGTPGSGVTPRSVIFSNNAGASYAYTPQLDADRCDSAVTHAKVLMNGSFSAADSSNTPYLELKFIGYLK